MKQVKTLGLIITAVVILASCGGSKKEGDAALNDKKAALEKLKSDKTKTEAEIKKLQDELDKIDTSAASASKVKLVTTTPVTTGNFQHYIDLQGKVDAENISYISPRGMGGQVKTVLVKQGDHVRKGQLLLKLDNAIASQQMFATRQQLDGAKAQLALAKSVYERRSNLWKEGVGTEVELLKAKTDVAAAEGQVAVINQNIKLNQEQINTSNVYSDVDGIADIVNIRVGETFSGMGASGPQIKIVNNSSLKVVTNVPENYITRLHKGSPVEIDIPDANKKFSSTISLISQSVDPTQRGFIAEAKIPADATLKPSQSAVVKILDYAATNVIIIPVNVIQSDETGKYVYVLSKGSNGKNFAHRITVTMGEVYGESVEIKSGLKTGDQLVTEGFQNLYEGQMITTEIK
jgi:membrane fusion protein (multidrug efflux system)